MTQIELSHGAAPGAPRRPPRLLRWTIRLLFTLCGVLMVLVLLSEPRVAARVGAVLDEVQTLITAPPAPPATDAAASGLRVYVDPEIEEAPARPAVRVMPQDRVPVRRAGN